MVDWTVYWFMLPVCVAVAIAEAGSFASPVYAARGIYRHMPSTRLCRVGVWIAVMPGDHVQRRGIVRRPQEV